MTFWVFLGGDALKNRILCNRSHDEIKKGKNSDEKSIKV
jgi:hypothetical protein